MSKKPEQDARRESLEEERELELIDEACERLVRAVTQASAAKRLTSTLQKAAGYAALALGVLVAGSVAAQDRPTARLTGEPVPADQEETGEEREERLEDATEAREEAREAREDEREAFEENAAERAERRQEARVARWETIAELGELRSPTQLSEEARDELLTHARREARLRAIRYRAVGADDSVTVTRVDAVLEREALRHDVALTPLLAAPREHTATEANKAPIAGGAQ